jgi:hypothetical protein
MSGLQNMTQRLDSSSFSVVAIAVESDWQAIQDLVELRKITFPVALDRTGGLKNLFRISGVPQTALLDPAGRLIKVIDPKNLSPVDRIDGPREWDSAASVSAYRRLTRPAL